MSFYQNWQLHFCNNICHVLCPKCSLINYTEILSRAHGYLGKLQCVKQMQSDASCSAGSNWQSLVCTCRYDATIASLLAPGQCCNTSSVMHMASRLEHEAHMLSLPWQRRSPTAPRQDPHSQSQHTYLDSQHNPGQHLLLCHHLLHATQQCQSQYPHNPLRPQHNQNSGQPGACSLRCQRHRNLRESRIRRGFRT